MSTDQITFQTQVINVAILVVAVQINSLAPGGQLFSQASRSFRFRATSEGSSQATRRTCRHYWFYRDCTTLLSPPCMERRGTTGLRYFGVFVLTETMKGADAKSSLLVM